MKLSSLFAITMCICSVSALDDCGIRIVTPSDGSILMVPKDCTKLRVEIEHSGTLLYFLKLPFLLIAMVRELLLAHVYQME